MMYLVLKEMHEEAVAAFGLYPRVALDPHDTIQKVWRERVANFNQTFVDSRLSARQFGNGWTWHFVLPGFWSSRATFKRVDVKQVDNVDVVESQLKAGEEASPFGFEVSLEADHDEPDHQTCTRD